MIHPFGESYACAYDALYRDKDYEGECDQLERLFATHGQGPVRSVLDLGCGTGAHAVALAARGYEMVGVDRSASMLATARNKAARASVSPRFEHADLRDVRLGRTFDAALMMFAVLGYQLENDDVRRALDAARRHLEPNGLLVCDVWYGPAVLANRPSERIREVRTAEGTILRAASGTLDVARHVCTVSYRLWDLRDASARAPSEETHPMRFFFPKEIDLFFDVCRLRLLRLASFPAIDQPPSESTWNVVAVGRSVA